MRCHLDHSGDRECRLGVRLCHPDRGAGRDRRADNRVRHAQSDLSGLLGGAPLGDAPQGRLPRPRRPDPTRHLDRPLRSIDGHSLCDCRCRLIRRRPLQLPFPQQGQRAGRVPLGPPQDDGELRLSRAQLRARRKRVPSQRRDLSQQEPLFREPLIGVGDPHEKTPGRGDILGRGRGIVGCHRHGRRAERPRRVGGAPHSRHRAQRGLRVNCDQRQRDRLQRGRLISGKLNLSGRRLGLVEILPGGRTPSRTRAETGERARNETQHGARVSW